ncbi:hypothetical protein SETIT_3G149500v2 [Setaria italica]|uniref:Uncharacterized protein n=1 Tax=Setaria italica TaxID=4555 RepID=A0A368QH33_SETIT|nr:hypothetical protein SETIT_3G149500v2 [Setaria italica]
MRRIRSTARACNLRVTARAFNSLGARPPRPYQPAPSSPSAILLRAQQLGGGGREMSRAAQTGAGGGGAARLKASPRALFSCGIFSTCTHPALSPTATPNNNVVPGSGGIKGGGGTGTPCAEGSASPVVEASAPPPPPQRQHQRAQRNVGPSSSSSSSSSSASQSFTQWRLPVHHPPHASASASASASGAGAGGDALLSAEEKFAAGEVVAALRTVEREMEAAARPVPAGVVAGVVAAVREPATARLAAKVLLVVLLEEGNRETAVEAGAASAAVEAVAASGPAGATAERALAALELLCTAPGGAAAVRREALAAPVLARAEDGAESPPPPEVVKAVVAAMQGRVQRARTAQGCAAPSRAAGGRSPWARVGRRRRSLTRGARPPATGPAPRALVPSPRLHAGPASQDRFRGSATDLVAAVGPRLLKRGPGMRTGRSSDLALVGEMLEETVGGVIDLWSPFVAPLPL